MINDVVNNGPFAKPSAPSGPTASGATAASTAKDATAAGKASAPSPEQLKAAVSKLNDYVQNIQRSLSFSVDEDTGITVVKVIDTQTNELVRQIPTEQMLKLAADIDKQTASLFEARA